MSIDLSPAPPAPEPSLPKRAEVEVEQSPTAAGPASRAVGSWSFYSEKDGRFLSRHLTSTSRESVKLNTPAGYRAIDGRYDRFMQRVDLATGEVIVDESLAAARDDQRRRDGALAAIAELERQQLRPLRELARDPANRTARLKIDAIDIEIAQLREQLKE